MKKILATIFLSGLTAMAVQADEVTLAFADLELDASATLSNQKVNDNISISSTGNASWNATNGDFRLFSGGGLSVEVTNATLTGISITCNSGYGFSALSTVTVDGQSTTDFTASPFSWTGEATESWAVIATPASNNVRVESITFTYAPQAVAETKSVSVKCNEMGVATDSSLPATGYQMDDYVNVNFVQGTHTSTPTYRTAENGCFYIFNGQQVVVTATNGAILKKIEIITSTNNFGYSGFVTADGVTQTYDTDYLWVPFSWEGSAEQNVTVQNGLSSGNTRVTGLTVTYVTPGVGINVAKPVITPADTDNTVTITCDTPDAQIYYTLDGTDPTAEDGTLYTGAITLTQSCTVKAVAVLDGVSSSVASLDVTLKQVDNLADFLANGSNKDAIRINGPITAIVGSGSYLAIKDAQGNYAVIYNTDYNLADAINVENGTTWSYITAKMAVQDTDIEVYFVEPVEFGEVSTGTAVEPVEMEVTDESSAHAPYEYAIIRNVKVQEDNNYYNYWILTDEDDNEFENAFKKFSMVTYPDDEEGRYDVTGIVSPADPEDDEFYQFWPLSFEKKETTGVESIEDVVKENTGKTVYYNLNGVRVENPGRGVYIKETDGKAKKVLVKE